MTMNEALTEDNVLIADTAINREQMKKVAIEAFKDEGLDSIDSEALWKRIVDNTNFRLLDPKTETFELSVGKYVKQ